MDKHILLTQAGRSCRLLAPAAHSLDFLRRTYPLYDVFYPRLTKLVADLAPSREVIVDVGANIGDTTALCRLEGCRLPIVAIEPSEVFYPYLERNVCELDSFYDDTTPIPAYIGRADDNLSLSHSGGTASSIKNAAPLPGKVPTFTLSRFCRGGVAVVKIDTDGYDLEIVCDNLTLIREARPILWVEAEIRSDDTESVVRWRETMSDLEATHPLVCAFDNFGFPLCSGPLEARKQTIGDVLNYAWRHGRHPRATHGAPTIYYLDIAFFPERFSGVFETFASSLGDVPPARNPAGP